MQNCNERSAKGGPLRCKTLWNGVPRGTPSGAKFVQNWQTGQNMQKVAKYTKLCINVLNVPNCETCKN